MEGDFSWLWRNEELSDFTLVIREVPQRSHDAPAGGAEAAAAATDAADALQQGVQTRSGKRRRSNTNSVDAATRSNTRRRSAQQQHPPADRLAEPDAAADGASPAGGLDQQQQQEHVSAPHAAGAAADTRQGDAGTRATRRGTRQRQQQQAHLQQQDQDHLPQQQQQQDDQEQLQNHPHAAPVGRRTRRSSANAQQQQGRTAEPEAPAAAGAGRHRRTSEAAAGAAAAAATGQQQDDGAAAAGDAAGQTGRVTRSSRAKQRAPDAAAAAAGGANTRTRAEQQQSQQEQRRQQQQQHEVEAPPATRRSLRRQQMMQQLQHSMQQLTTGSDGGAAGPSNALLEQHQEQQQQQVQGAAAAAAGAADAVEIRVPVHAVVLAGFSEYFKALICSWSGNLNKTLTLDVGVDEGHAALLMVQFMYTGKLPDASPEDLLKMVRLADQYQVTRFMAAASSSFEALPLSSISQTVMLEVFRLPQLMLDAPEMSRVLTKARAKLLDLYGDLEKVWACESLRDQFLALPYPAVRCLLSSEGTTVAAENTALVVLTGWVEEGLYGRNATAAQRKELLNLVRLPFLTSSFVGDVLHGLPWVRDALDSRQLINAFQFAISSESTRQRLATYDYGPSAITPHYRSPRPASAVTRASFEWSIELSTIKRMVADAKLWGRVVELSSPLHYFGGFWWQLLFNVEKTPAPPDAPPDVAAAAPPTVVEFVGVRCHVNCGSHDFWPRVVRFKATIAALQTGFWEMDYAYSKAIEGPIVDGVGLGYPGFFALPGQALESEAAWSRFVRNGRVQLRCEVTDCE